MLSLDCTFNSNWVQKMVSCFVDSKIKLVSGPVIYKKKTGIFHDLQCLEFISLIGSGAGAIGVGSPIFCNGANMAYRKDVFLELNNFAVDKIVSGDDVFLLHAIKSKYPQSIAFIKDYDSIVTTNSINKLNDFINQRKRWVAKSSSYKDLASIYVSFLILSLNFIILFLFFYSLKIFVFFYVVKYIIDLIFLYPKLIFFQRKDLVKWIFPFQFFYSIYVVLIVVLSFTKRFDWKGRLYRK